MRINILFNLMFALIASTASAFTVSGQCVAGKFVKTCVGDSVYVLENRSDYEIDEEEALLFVRVDQKSIAKVGQSEIALKGKVGFLSKLEVFRPEQIIVRKGCVFKNRYCVGESVYIPGYNVFPTGDIVGVFMDGRVLVERMGQKVVMNTRDLVRLREE